MKRFWGDCRMNLTEVQALSDWIYCYHCYECKAYHRFCGRAASDKIEDILTSLSNSYCLQRIVCCRYYLCDLCPLRLKCAKYPNRPTSTSRLYAEFGGLRNIDKEIEKLYREIMEKENGR